MHGEIAKVFNDFDLGKNRRSDGVPKTRCMNKRAQVVLIGKFQSSVVFVEPRHGQLQSPPCVETCRARIGIRQRLRFRRRVEQSRPFVAKKLELRVRSRHFAILRRQKSVDLCFR
jgi:hypothetical protein